MATEQLIKFHKRQPGLYGTGVWRSTVGRWEFLYCEHQCTDVEICIDGRTHYDGWCVRYVCEHDCFTDIVGEWYPTLRDAKEEWVAFMLRRIG